MWRDNLDQKTQKSLNKLLLEVSKEKLSYEDEKNPSRIQMWIALALVNYKIEELNLRIEGLSSLQKISKLKKSLKKL